MKIKSLRKAACIVILFILFFGMFAAAINLKTAHASPAWWNNSWSYRTQITISHTMASGTLSDFPVLIDITSPDLAAYAQTNGNDIVFTGSDGVTVLNCEIESYNSATGQLVAWVNVPSLSSTADTVLYMYYGNPTCASQQNPTGVWDSNFMMVLHLAETSGTQHDSTSNGHNASPNGGVTEGVSGKIDGADSFSGSASQYLSVGAVSASDWTVSFWANSQSTSNPAIYPIGLGGSTGIGMGGTYSDNHNEFYVYDGSNVLVGGPQVATNTWDYVSVTKSSTTYTIYVNGAEQVSGTLAGIGITNLNIGRRSDGIASLVFTGILDEIRVSNIARSSDWILTEYNNQNNPSAFITVGTQESSGATIVSYSPQQAQLTLNRGSSQTFQIAFSDTMDMISWDLNGTQMQSTSGVSTSSWTYNFNSLGIFNVSAVGTLNGQPLSQTWMIQVIINFASGIQTNGQLYMPPSQPWENGWVFDQTVWQDQGYYYMLYSGGPIGSRQLGFAWSTDGLNWTKDPNNPIVSPTAGSWDSKEVFWASSVIKVAPDTYWAYIQGQDSSGGFHSGVIFLTIQGTDLESVQQYSGNPIVTDTYELVVAQVNSTFWVGYNGYGLDQTSLLTSPDGLHWTYQQHNVLLPDGKSWDNSILYQQHAFIMDNTLYLVVVGNNQQLGLYYTEVGNWANLTPSPYNPIIPSGSGYDSYVLGGPVVYNPTLDSLDIWFSCAQSLGGTGQSGCGFGRLYGVTGMGTPPVISNPTPANGATNVPISQSILSFQAQEYDGQQMNYTVTTSPNIGTGSGLNITNGAVSINVSGLAYSTAYSWTVDLISGNETATQTYSFTTAPNPYVDPFSEGWQYYQEITVNHALVPSDQTDFPVLLDITDADLAQNAQPNGNDILFTDGLGLALKLNSQIESYTASTGQLVAWVQLPTVSSTVDTTFYMYYGNGAAQNQQNPTQVWDPNYVLVLHLNEDSGTQYDSTTYQNDATPYGVVQGASGIIGGADYFGSGTPYLVDTSDGSLSPTILTVEAWIQPQTVSGTHPIVEKYDWAQGSGGYILRQVGNSLFFDVLQGQTDNIVWANNVLQVGNWYDVVGTFDGSYLRIYVNGQLVNQLAWSGTNLPSSATLKIGTRGNDGASSGLFFNGMIDEVRVSSIARSAGWITTEYNNEANPSSFCTVGPQVSNGLFSTPENILGTIVAFAACFAAFLSFTKLKPYKKLNRIFKKYP